MTAIGLTLLWCMIQATAVAAAALGTSLLCARAGARARGGAALAGLVVAAALAPLAFSPWPRWTMAEPRPVVAETVVTPAVEAPPPVVRPTPETVLSGVAGAAWDAFRNELRRPRSEVLPPRPVSTEGSVGSPVRSWWPAVVVTLFAAGAAVGLIRLAAGAWAVRRCVRRATPVFDPELFGLLDVLRAELSCVTPVELRESASIATAATAGWRKPVLLLPPEWGDWTPDERRAVLAHELAHVKRRDFVAGCAVQAALAVHFYHPAMHWLAGRVRLEQELAADALAASVSGGRAAYLRTLAELALRRPSGRVAWPARAFLPTRRTFLRRLEMLRDPRRFADRPAPLLRGASAGGLLLFGLLVAGVRRAPAEAQPPAGPEAARAASERPGKPRQAAAKAEEQLAPALAYLPATDFVVVSLRPKAALEDPALKPFADVIAKSFADSPDPVVAMLRDAGVTPEMIEEVAVGTSQTRPGGPPEAMRVVLRLSAPVEFGAALEKASRGRTTVLGGVLYRIGGQEVAFPDARTVALSADRAMTTAMLIAEAVGDGSSPWLRLRKELGDPPFAVLIDTAKAAAMVKAVPFGDGPNPALAMLTPFLPLVNDTQLVGLGLNFGDGDGIVGYAECSGEEAAVRVADTLKALLTLARNSVRQFRQGPGPGGGEEMDALFAAMIPKAEKLLASVKVEPQGDHVTLKAEVEGGWSAATFGLLLPSVHKAREAARRAQSTNNLKQIALAFHVYHDKHGHFPPAVIEENGMTRSWRVEILPYIDQKPLYDRYRKGEPWDSPANKQLLAEMPAIYRHPAAAADSTDACYFVLTGPAPIPATGPQDKETADLTAEQAAKSTVFTAVPIKATDNRGPGLMSIIDGSSNTLLAVEAKRDVPWTKPEDIAFDPAKAGQLVKSLGGYTPGGFNVAFCDGAVRFLSTAIDPAVFTKPVTPAGGEVVDTELFKPSFQPSDPQ